MAAAASHARKTWSVVVTVVVVAVAAAALAVQHAEGSYVVTSDWSDANCTGVVYLTSYWPTGACHPYGPGQWAVAACNATGSMFTYCDDALCTVNCTADAFAPHGCGQRVNSTSDTGCAATIPAPSANSIVTQEYADSSCTVPSEVLHTPVGCQRFNATSFTRTVGCNSPFTWSADCSDSTCAAGTCTNNSIVSVNDLCTSYRGYTFAKRECIPAGGSAAPAGARPLGAVLIPILIVLAIFVCASF